MTVSPRARHDCDTPWTMFGDDCADIAICNGVSSRDGNSCRGGRGGAPGPLGLTIPQDFYPLFFPCNLLNATYRWPPLADRGLSSQVFIYLKNPDILDECAPGLLSS